MSGCVVRGSGGRVGRKAIDERRRINGDTASRHTQHARQRNLRQCDGLLRLYQACLSGGALGVAPRCFGPRPQLIVHEGVDRARQEIPTIDIGLERRHRPLGADDVQERRADRGLDVEPRQRVARARTGDGSFGAGDCGLTKAEVERLPRERARPSRSPTRCRRTPPEGPDRTSRESPTAAAPGRRCCWRCRGSTARANRAAASTPISRRRHRRSMH